MMRIYPLKKLNLVVYENICLFDTQVLALGSLPSLSQISGEYSFRQVSGLPWYLAMRLNRLFGVVPYLHPLLTDGLGQLFHLFNLLPHLYNREISSTQLTRFVREVNSAQWRTHSTCSVSDSDGGCEGGGGDDAEELKVRIPDENSD